MKNPSGGLQRANIVNRAGPFATEANLEAVIHGKLTSGGDPATLLAVQFKFLPSNADRRARQATFSLQFRDDAERGADGPEVYGIAPNGDMFISPMVR